MMQNSSILLNSDNFSLIFFLVVFIILPVIVIGCLIPVWVRNARDHRFVSKHSLALKELEELNKKYTFKKIPVVSYIHSYDNENFYGDISCKDYLTYQLVYEQSKVYGAIKDANDNKQLFRYYLEDIKEKCLIGHYDVSKLPDNEKRLHKIERKKIIQQSKAPIIDFSIYVKLELTNINGAHRTSKNKTFHEDAIKEIISQLRQKRGSFYLNDNVWQSICRVERGKVTNRMRFAIYKRDNYRCCKCGRKTNDLEIDHIYPIAKGGKTTIDNLQTLCHRCNVKKGSSIEY